MVTSFHKLQRVPCIMCWLYTQDIVSFTSTSSELHPAEVLLFLNNVFSDLDNLVEVHGVYKVETIGGAFSEFCVVVCALLPHASGT